MPARGKLIALEGIDGSGKRTQIEMLSRALTERGVEHTSISFPHYEGFFGRLVAGYLNGKFGKLANVDPHFSALLYAGDRLESRHAIEEDLNGGKLVLADRYVGSNLAHQAARVPAAKRNEFIRWIENLEYKVYGLPREDMVIFLRVPVEQARRLVNRKSAREYTRRRRDLQEASFRHLEEASRVYQKLARTPHWTTVECMNGRPAALLAPEIIHAKIMAAIESRMFA